MVRFKNKNCTAKKVVRQCHMDQAQGVAQIGDSDAVCLNNSVLIVALTAYEETSGNPKTDVFLHRSDFINLCQSVLPIIGFSNVFFFIVNRNLRLVRHLCIIMDSIM